MTAFLMMFRRFPTTFRRLPKTFEEDPKMFRWYTNEFKYSLRDKLDLCEIIDIFSSEDIVTSHVKTSYRFYQFVTTRYTTQWLLYNKIWQYYFFLIPQYLGLRRVQLEAVPALRPGNESLLKLVRKKRSLRLLASPPTRHREQWVHLKNAKTDVRTG